MSKSKHYLVKEEDLRELIASRLTLLSYESEGVDNWIGCEYVETTYAEEVSLVDYEEAEPPLYKVIRSYFDETHVEHRMVVRTDLTLAEARAHCSLETTQERGVWMDVFTAQ